MQSQIRYCEEGLIIPSDWLKDIGSEVSVQKSGQVIIIETKQREMARKRLKKMVKSLRQSARQVEPISESEIANIVNEVRESRARDY
jgi:TATA-box binding protein (TBP) (component of TFIID and TFIIIB)